MPRCNLISLVKLSMSSIWVTLAIYQLLSCSFLETEAALKFKIPMVHHGKGTTEAHHTTAHHDQTTAHHTTTHHPATTPHKKEDHKPTPTHHPGTTPHGKGHTTAHHGTPAHHTTPHHDKVKATSKAKPKPPPKPVKKKAKVTTTKAVGQEHHTPSYPLSTTEASHHNSDKGRKHGSLWVSDITEMSPFAEANDTCSEMGGALVTIVTQDDLERVEHVLRHVGDETPGAIFSFWVGASHRYRHDGKEGDFWSDSFDTPVTENSFSKNDSLLSCHEFDGAYTVAYVFQEIYLCRRDENLSCRYICRIE